MDHPLKPMTVTVLHFIQLLRVFFYMHVLQVIESRSIRKLGSLSKSSSTTSSTISLLEPVGTTLDGCDPLTLMAKQDTIDPLSQMVAEVCLILDFFHSSQRS